MRLFITGIGVTLIFSLVAFILSFQACDSVTHSIDAKTYDTIETNDCGGDIINDTAPPQGDTTSKFEKVEWIVFDTDGEIVDRRIADNI